MQWEPAISACWHCGCCILQDNHCVIFVGRITVFEHQKSSLFSEDLYMRVHRWSATLQYDHQMQQLLSPTSSAMPEAYSITHLSTYWTVDKLTKTLFFYLLELQNCLRIHLVKLGLQQPVKSIRKS